MADRTFVSSNSNVGTNPCQQQVFSFPTIISLPAAGVAFNILTVSTAAEEESKMDGDPPTATVVVEKRILVKDAMEMDTKSAYAIALESCNNGHCQSTASITDADNSMASSNDDGKIHKPLWKIIEAKDDLPEAPDGPKREWEPVYHWFHNISKKEAKAKVLETNDGDGATALHSACLKQAPLDIIRKILDIGGAETAKLTDAHGRLPLHCACIFESDLNVIQHLIDFYPDGACQKDIYDKLPLHYLAAEDYCNPQAMQALIHAYPDGTRVRDGEGNLPLHLACRYPSGLQVIKALTDVYPAGAGEKDSNGSLPVHDACRYKGTPQQAILHLIDIYPESADECDSSGRLAVHLASYRGFFKVVKALIDLYPDGVCEKDRDGRLPLHLACKQSPDPSQQVILHLIDVYRDGAADKDIDGDLPLHHYIACQQSFDLQVLAALIAAHPKSMEERNIHGRTPFQSSKKGSDGASKYLHYILHNEGYWNGGSVLTGERKLKSCMEYMPHEIFLSAISQNIDSKQLVPLLNRMSCNQVAVFYIMRDLYIYVALIVSFISATNQYLLEEEPNLGWAISLIPLAIVLFLIELLQLWRRKKNGETAAYFVDVWNWIELTAIALILASAERLIMEEYVQLDGDTERTRRLLMFTGFFLFGSLVSFMKKALLPFATFVGGVMFILWALIPFLVMAGMTLVTFGYMYFVSYSDQEGFETMMASLFSVFSAVIGGQHDAAVGLLDIVFGVVTAIVLLNVLIAIVCKAWNQAIERKYARAVFWQYRIAFILEMGIDDLNEEAEWDSEDKLVLGPVGLRFILRCISLAFKFVLGVLSFGYCWPMHMRKNLFAEKLEIDEESTEKAETKELVSLITEQSTKLDKMDAENKQLVNKVVGMTAENKLLSFKIADMKAGTFDLALEMKTLQSQNNRILVLLEGLSKQENK
ncbi:unnamed protein product [Cylindrotheca closterium]|uniref:Ion transport domain-containing protein n=1 Tax=Cylindrotheca closterium TaxID=2856 RepID=A0AAD2CKM6_9STRA|nr:unnamed protein product [Cylindrotheca closterium]